MALYNLDNYQILTLTAILVPSLVAIWVIFLQKDLTEKINEYKKILKSYEKEEAEKLLRDIQDAINAEKKDAVEIIINYSEEWKLKSEAFSQLINKENWIYKIGKWIIYLLFFIFLFGLFASPRLNLIISDKYVIPTIDILQVVFLFEVFLILCWFILIFDYAHLLNKVQTGDIKDVKGIIDDIILEIKRRRRK